MKKELKSILKECTNADQTAQEVAKGWCIANGKCGQNKRSGIDCFTFYYWLGNIVSENLKEKKELFSNIMRDIYNNGGVGTKGICSDMCPKINKEDFKKLMEVYNYTKIYNIINSRVRMHRGIYKEACRKYLKGIERTYESLNIPCTKERYSGSHCEELNNMFHRGRTVKKPSELGKEIFGKEWNWPVLGNYNNSSNNSSNNSKNSSNNSNNNGNNNNSNNNSNNNNSNYSNN
ncbi:ubiquitin carboxyl-terminal hydrolase [Plasmodium cynomolgi strain B]|uniref:Ubiquitin carboxyl-terminal hydrolase n=1 Tax=Plasmodium cynomolgi (strain B) TaxID=1120755 RepID=K6UZV9_PLACD|nr:ubiquitin carboxyl-terminal hydrolase [Plasmodium cynomolgi strain B]GAB69524.1 ubiquitin carboxyl-terminal hydrolase [Plasmodium cynomolgi strain B]